MQFTILTIRALRFGLLIAGSLVAASAGAMAGECAADRIVADGKGQQDQGMSAKDVTDNVLASIDLSKEMVALNDRKFRMRRLEIQAGGIVPWHSHADRPALIYVVAGEVTEYASTCADPIVHKAGDVSIDSGRSHWWKNTGGETVVLISADILHDKMDASM